MNKRREKPRCLQKFGLYATAFFEDMSIVLAAAVSDAFYMFSLLAHDATALRSRMPAFRPRKNLPPSPNTYDSRHDSEYSHKESISLSLFSPTRLDSGSARNSWLDVMHDLHPNQRLPSKTGERTLYQLTKRQYTPLYLLER
jgi:hypothetical protein